jgi:hypothetical protein
MSDKAAWRRFVNARRVELRDAFPCAAPTQRRICPRHGRRVGSVTRICKPCRDALYGQLATEYRAADLRQKGEAA